MKIDVKLKSRSYPIYIKNNSFHDMFLYIKDNIKFEKVAIITDDNVNAIYRSQLTDILNRQGNQYTIISIKPGEESKSLHVAEDIYDRLLDEEFSRSDIIIALGGGIVGDLAGFVASTLLRGIPFIQIPTTLLAQIDSSVGGKVAVNMKAGKNLVGAFYQPICVIIDPNFLQTLEKRVLYDGIGELIKYGCISDISIIEALEKIDNIEDVLENIDELIFKSCNIKRILVEEDEFDKGERMLLNFGHTLGHCIERYYNYKKYTHGEAVAIGMAHITYNTEAMGITEKGTYARLITLLERFKLPYKIQEVDRDGILKLIKHDKKTLNGFLNIIVLEKLGISKICEIRKDEVRKYF